MRTPHVSSQSFVVPAEVAVEACQTSQGPPALAEPHRGSRDLAEVRGTSQRCAGPRRGPWDLAEVRRRLNFLFVGAWQRSAGPRRGSRDLAEVRGASQKLAGPRRASLGFAEARRTSQSFAKAFYFGVPRGARFAFAEGARKGEPAAPPAKFLLNSKQEKHRLVSREW